MARIVDLPYQLLKGGYLTQSQIDQALNSASCRNISLLQVLMDNGWVSSDIIIETIAKIMDLPILEAQFQKITILDFNKVSEYSLKGYFICKDPLGKEYLIINNPLLLEDEELRTKYRKHKIMLMRRQEFYNALEQAFSKFNTQKALLELGFFNPEATAKNINYPTALTKGLGGICALVYISSGLFIAVNYFIYLTQTLFKMWLFIETYIAMPTTKTDASPRLRKYYPVYSILVPMYKENYGVKAILHALDRLEYPKHRLDIKLVVEEDDEISLKILSMIKLPDHVHVIKVPYSEPRTKPKALNYAMQYVKGEYVVIYDVEDVPDKDQLIKALDMFENAPKNVICVQAKLNFYNRYFNLLSRLFSIEYSIWFNFLLPALELNKMSVPLGGNSNHFKTQAIKDLGLWDAYNVTEDADLGVRIFMCGYRTKIIDSYTMEEAPTDIPNWVNQRARWIKGFVQTFWVYYGQKTALKSNMGLRAGIGVYIFIGLATYSFFIIPWHLLAMVSNLSLENKFLAEISIYITILYLYCTASVVITQDTNSFKNVQVLDCIALMIWPLYFILHSAASYKALWELITKPFSWNKTEHAMSQEDYDYDPY